MTDTSTTDRRNSQRVELRREIRLLAVDHDEVTIKPRQMSVWTKDLSLSGVQLITEVPLEEDRVWLRFDITGIDSQFIDAEIVRSGEVIESSQSRFTYALKFRQVLNEDQFLDIVFGPLDPVETKATAEVS